MILHFFAMHELIPAKGHSIRAYLYTISITLGRTLIAYLDLNEIKYLFVLLENMFQYLPFLDWDHFLATYT